MDMPAAPAPRQDLRSDPDQQHMTPADQPLTWMRETDGGHCGACGYDLGQWETGFAIELVVEAIFRDLELLDRIFVRHCPGCGVPYEWDILVFEGADDLDQEQLEARATAAEVRQALSAMLDPSLPRRPRTAAAQIRRRFGVEAVYVEQASDLPWRLRRLQDGPL